MDRDDAPLLESRLVLLYRLARIRRELDDVVKMVAAMPWPEDTQGLPNHRAPKTITLTPG